MDHKYLLEEHKRKILITGTLIALFLLWQFVIWPLINLGSLQVEIIGAQNGELTAYSLKDKVASDDKPVHKSKHKSSNFTIKLEPGKYKVVFKAFSDSQSKETFSEVAIRSRKSSRVSLSFAKTEVSGIAKSIYKPKSLKITPDKLQLLSSYGTASVFNLKGDSVGSIGNPEGALANNLTSICSLSDGSLVTTETTGRIYRVKNNSASLLNLPSTNSTSGQPEGFELQNQGFLSGTNDLVCMPDQVIIFGRFIYKLKSSVLESFKPNKEWYSFSSSADTNQSGKAILYNRTDENSYGHDAENNPYDPYKIMLYAKEGESKELKTSETVSSASYYKGLICYHNLQKIYCFNNSLSDDELVLDLPDNQIINNAIVASNDTIIYSYQDGVYSLSLSNGHSSLLYRARGSILPKSFDYNPDSATLVLAVDVSKKEPQDKYEIPILKINTK